MQDQTAMAIARALDFVQWFRRMVIQEQITVSAYALEGKPESDYILQEALRDELKRSSS